jgi:hypothetical protein
LEALSSTKIAAVQLPSPIQQGPEDAAIADLQQAAFQVIAHRTLQ